MNKQLPQNLINQCDSLGILNDVSWDEGITNITHLNYVMGMGLSVPAEIVEFANDPNVPVIVEDDADVTYPPPIPLSVSQTKFVAEKDLIKFKIHGCYFSPGNTISSNLITINKVSFIDAHQFEIEVDTLGIPAGKVGNLKINGIVAATIETVESSWIDFREGGDPIDKLDLVSIAESEVVRDADGIGTNKFTNAWRKLLGLPDYAIRPDHDQGIQLIYKKQTVGYSMFGLISDNREIDNTMYNNTVSNIYVQTQDRIWGFHSYRPRANRNTITDFNRIKLVYPSTLTPDSEYSVYGLSDSDSWDDQGTLIYTAKTPAGDQPVGNFWYPCITPHNGSTCRLQAFNPSYS